VRVYTSAKWSDLNITITTTTTTNTPTTTPYNKERGGRRKSRFTTGERERKVIAGVAACAVGDNDVTAIMSHHVRTQKDRITKLLISSNVHYVHLGGDNNNKLISTVSCNVLKYRISTHFCSIFWPYTPICKMSSQSIPDYRSYWQTNGQEKRQTTE